MHEVLKYLSTSTPEEYWVLYSSTPALPVWLPQEWCHRSLCVYVPFIFRIFIVYLLLYVTCCRTLKGDKQTTDVICLVYRITYSWWISNSFWPKCKNGKCFAVWQVTSWAVTSVQREKHKDLLPIESNRRSNILDVRTFTLVTSGRRRKSCQTTNMANVDRILQQQSFKREHGKERKSKLNNITRCTVSGLEDLPYVLMISCIIQFRF